MESTKSNLDLLNRKINDNLDYYFIKWLNSFEVNSVDIDMKSELVDRINDYKMNSYISSSLKNDGLDKYDIDIEINHPKYGIIRLEYRFNRFIIIHNYKLSIYIKYLIFSFFTVTVILTYCHFLILFM